MGCIVKLSCPPPPQYPQQRPQQQQTVHSLDLVAAVPGVIACNMASTPLDSGSCDVAVFRYGGLVWLYKRFGETTGTMVGCAGNTRNIHICVCSLVACTERDERSLRMNSTRDRYNISICPALCVCVCVCHCCHSHTTRSHTTHHTFQTPNSLALMGTDYGSFLVEASRVLKPGGWLWVAEVSCNLLFCVTHAPVFANCLFVADEVGIIPNDSIVSSSIL